MERLNELFYAHMMNIMQILQIMLAESYWWFVNLLVLQCLMKNSMKKVVYHGLSLNNRENGYPEKTPEYF